MGFLCDRGYGGLSHGVDTCEYLWVFKKGGI